MYLLRLVLLSCILLLFRKGHNCAGGFYFVLSIASTGLIGPLVLLCLYVYDRHAKGEDMADPPNPPIIDADAQITVTVDPTEPPVPTTANDSTVSTASSDPSNTSDTSPPTTQAQVQSPSLSSGQDDTATLLKMAAANLSSQDNGIEPNFNKSKLQDKWSSKRSVNGTHVSKCSADLLDCFQDNPDRSLTDENNNQASGTFVSPTVTEVSYTRRNESLSKIRRNSVIDPSQPPHETEYRSQFRRKESTSKTSLKKPTDHLGAQSLSTPSESLVDTSVGN